MIIGEFGIDGEGKFNDSERDRFLEEVVSKPISYDRSF